MRRPGSGILALQAVCCEFTDLNQGNIQSALPLPPCARAQIPRFIKDSRRSEKLRSSVLSSLVRQQLDQR